MQFLASRGWGGGGVKIPGELGLAELTVFKGAIKYLAGSVLSDLIY